nr:hypothetical protein [Micromonospora sp. DSM 115978]
SQDGLLTRRDYDPSQAQRVLGAGLGLYTRLNPSAIDNDWLGRFNHYNQSDPLQADVSRTSFENNLLAGLIPHGRFSPQFLGLLGDRIYDTNTGDVRDTGWGLTFGQYGTPQRPGSTEPDVTPLTYQAVVIEAIAGDTLLAGEFADRHLDRILAQSRSAAGGYGRGGGGGVPAANDRLEDGRIALLRTATLAPSWLRLDGPRVDRALLQAATENAETVVAHLAFLQAAAPATGHVSAPMQGLYGEILHTYRDDMYRSVTTLAPETAALVGPDGNIVDT